MDVYEPRVIAFLCKWCSSAGSDLAGVSRMQYPPNVVPITVMCSGSVSPLYVLTAFKKGADGVLVSGCHPGDCHYIKGNFYARRRIALLKELMEFMGFDERRFRMSWVSAAEGAKFTELIGDFVEELRPLGPQTQLKQKKLATDYTDKHGLKDDNREKFCGAFTKATPRRAAGGRHAAGPA